MASQTVFVAQTPGSEPPDPGTQHLYGTRLTISDGMILETTGNRYWCPASNTPTEPEWAVWDDVNGVLLASKTLVSGSLSPGWNAVPALASEVDLTGITSIIVYGRWYSGNTPFTTPGGFPFAGSGPDITAIGGTFGFGHVSAGPRASGGDFDLIGFADLSLRVGTPDPIPVTPVPESDTAVTPPAGKSRAATVVIDLATPGTPTRTKLRNVPFVAELDIAIGPGATKSRVVGVVELDHTPALGRAKLRRVHRVIERDRAHGVVPPAIGARPGTLTVRANGAGLVVRRRRGGGLTARLER